MSTHPNQWAKSAPNPDEKVIESIDGTKHSRSEIAEGIEKNTDLGKRYIVMIDVYVTSGRATLDDVLIAFTPKAPDAVILVLKLYP